MFPSIWVILNIFEKDTVNCLRTALCGGPKQAVSCDYTEFFFKQLVYKQLALGWQITKQP